MDKEQIHAQQNTDIQLVKKDISYLRGDIKDIKDNHLPHLYEELSSHKNWLVGVLVSVILTLIGVVISIFI